jgi:hypothetical protein
MIICKLDKATAGTKDTGDVVIIPATQSAPQGAGVNNPVPGADFTDPVLGSSRESMVTAAGGTGK